MQETFQKLLSLAVVSAARSVRLHVRRAGEVRCDGIGSERPVRPGHAVLAGTSGFLTTILGIALVFFPAQQITSLLWYEIWMFGGTLFFIGLAAFFFFVYGRRKASQRVELTALATPVPASEVRR